ncbi:MAG: efflux ABC transporter, permease protein [uncultured bacterium]|nr:MAG: efflux ABC transporter, permease protein [uncultured bacterium]
MINKTNHIHDGFSRWLISHWRAIRFAFIELTRAPVSNFIVISVIGIAIALPMGFYVLLENLQYVDHQWNTSSPTISLFLKTDIAQTQVDALMQQLQNNPHIAQVKYISPEQGLAEFQQNASFGSVVKLFQKNPIPGVITILPAKNDRDPAATNTLFSALKILPGVDIAQLDMNWVTRLYDIILVGKKITKALSLLFGFSVVLIIGHALRSSLAAHTKEILVMKLMGATHAYIRRPLLYRGTLYGFLGGTVAWMFITIFLAQIQPPISQLAQTYHTPFHLHTISISIGLLLLLVSALLGFFSAWIISTQFLNQPEQMD